MKDCRLRNICHMVFGLLTFTVNCQVYEPKINDIKFVPPFGIIRLNKTCKASNKYLQLPEYYGKYSNFERSDPFKALLEIHNVSQFSLWNETKTQTGYESLKLPPHLLGLKEIPVQSLLSEARYCRPIILDENKYGSNWVTVMIISVASTVVLFVTVWIILRKRQCIYQIIGKRGASMHDSERASVSRSPNPDDVELSTLVEEHNASDVGEGRKSFKWTDAAAAWAKK